MKRHQPALLIASLTLPVLAGGCGWLKSFFPDKEKDYQFTSELPELIVPNDLKAKSLTTRPAPAATDTVATAAPPPAAAEKQPGPPTDHAESKTNIAAANTDRRSEPASVSEPENSLPSVAPPGASSLQIDQPAKQAWRMVGKALSRKGIEIVERNLEKTYFFVKYNPIPNQVSQDNSIWGEFDFMFADNTNEEREYRISLQDTSPQTSEVTIQNEDGKTLSTDLARNLLRQITEGINQDLAK